MSTLPFSISADAAEFILELHRDVEQEHGPGKLVPVLTLCSRFQLQEADGRILERYNGLSIEIGWDAPENEAFWHYPAIEVHGQRVLVEPQTLEMLKGRELLLETVNVGYPIPAEKTQQILAFR